MSNKLLRGAIIGYGFIAEKGHVPAYQQRKNSYGDVDIVALSDISEARRIAAKAALPTARIYESYEELIEAEKDQIDFVDVTTPPSLHAEIVRKALANNLHVLCEKPLTIDPEDAKQLIRQAVQAQKVLYPCHNYKHSPIIKRVRQMITEGSIGKVISVNLQVYRNTYAKGSSEWNANWRHQKQFSGGGIAMDHGSHTFYLMFDWMGAFPRSVTAKTNCSETPGIDDLFVAQLSFPEGAAYVYLDWRAGMRKVLYLIQGDQGGIMVVNDEIELVQMKKTTNGIEWTTTKETIASDWKDPSHTTWFQSMFDDFKRAIQQNDFLNKEILDACFTIHVIQKAYESAQNHCKELDLHPLDI